MKEIPLTRGKVALVDDADFEWLSQFKWHVIEPKKGIFYANTAWREGKTVRHLTMHRLILGLTESHQKADHKDRNGLNNQRHNLRPATQAQNLANSLPRPGRVFKGVCLAKGYWRATIGHDYLGSFPSAEAAALAYNEAAIKRWGEFAVLNQL